MREVLEGSKHEVVVGDAEDNRPRTLTRRDWILIPLLSVLTICFMGASTELVARRMFRDNLSDGKCFLNPTLSQGAVPNSVCWVKYLESPLVEYRFNGCGHRAGMECGPKPRGAYRIVMIGASTAMGLDVPREKTIAALLPRELSEKTGREVQLYNEGLLSEHPEELCQRFNQVLAAKPDLILWVLNPFDIAVDPFERITQPAANVGFMGRLWFRMKGEFAAKSFPEGIRDLLGESRTVFMLRHFIYESQSLYLRSYLIGGEAVFLKTEISADWQRHLDRFAGYDAIIEAQAKAAGVPLVAVLLPTRAQAAMISMGEWPVGYNPYALDDELRAIITSHGGTYIDVLPDFRDIPNPEQYYFPVDGHPDDAGHAIISKLLVKELTRGAVPALEASAQKHLTLGRGR